MENEKVSIEKAEQSYGVVIDPETREVDEPATQRKRAELHAMRNQGENH